MRKNVFNILLTCGLLASTTAFAQENSAPALTLENFMTRNVHSVNPSLISDEQCKTLFESSYIQTKAKQDAAGIQTAIFAKNFKILDIKTLYQGDNPNPSSNKLVYTHLRLGRLHFTLNGKEIDTAIVITSFGPQPPTTHRFMLQSLYCYGEAQLK